MTNKLEKFCSLFDFSWAEFDTVLVYSLAKSGTSLVLINRDERNGKMRGETMWGSKCHVFLLFNNLLKLSIVLQHSFLTVKMPAAINFQLLLDF